MDNHKLKILLLEDDQNDVLQIPNILKEQKLDFEFTLVNTKEKYIQELTQSTPEIILSGYYSETFSSTEAIEILKNLKLNIPFILVTDAVNEDKAISFMQKGCTDYVLKEQFKRLPNTILKSAELFKSQKLYNESELKIKFIEEKHNSIIQHLPANIAILDNKGDIVFVNNHWKLYADENGYKGLNYGVGTNYIETARHNDDLNNTEGDLFANSIEKILAGELKDFSMVYPCHTPHKKKWFKAIASRESNHDNAGIVVMHIDVTEQQEAHLKALKSEANFLSIFNNTDIALILLDNDLNIVSSNKTANLIAQAALGIHSLDGNSLISLISEKGKKELKVVVKRVLKGMLFDKEIDYTLLNGDVKWSRVKMHSVTDKAGLIIGFCISAVDITEQVLYRKKVEESEIRFKSIAEQASDGIILRDLSGKFVFVNQAFCNMTGYTEKELLQMSSDDLIISDDSKADIYKTLIEHKQISINRRELKRKDKSMISVDLNEKIIKIHEKDFVVGVVCNVTNQLKNEIELIKAKIKAEKNEAKLVEAQRAAKIGNWETDLLNFNVSWSEETYKIFELDSNSYQPTHESFLTFVHPDDREKVDKSFMYSFNTEDYNSLEHRIITSKGNLKYVEEIWKIVYDENGLPVSTFGTCQDITERKIVEQELINTKIQAQENEFRLKLAAESAKIGVWDWDIRENKVTWDDTMFAIFGLENKINTNTFEDWVNRLHPDDKDKAIAEVNAAIKGEKNFDTSFRIVKPNDTIAYIKADGLVLCDMIGNSARMIGINRDITEQMEAENILKNSKNRLIKILQNSPIASCLSRLDHSVIFYNNQFTNLFGYTIDDIPNLEQWWLLAYPDENYRETIKKEWFARIEQAHITQSQFVTMDSKVRCKDGSYRFIEFYYANMDDEYLVNFNDITERIQYEEQLALSALIVNSIDDAIISKSIDGKVTSWNHGAEKLLGYKANEIIGKTTDHLKTSEVLEEEEKEIIAKVNAGESVYHYETKRKRKDGEQIDVSLTVSSIIDANGKVTGVSKILRDITYQKRMKEEREKNINNLLQRNRDLEQFSYIISHNLRGPVATILGLTNLMNDANLSEIEIKKIMSGVNASVNNLDSVIKDLNIILQVKGQSNEKKKQILFSDLVNEVELSLKDSIQKEGVKIFSDFDATDEILTLKSYMYSVFYNLISNSIKYRQSEVNPIIKIKSEIVGKDLILRFKDNGIGIDLEKYGHEVFGLNKRFNFNIEGRGLGLFMVKTQIESLGGRISLKSTINRGTEFIITFENYF
ncbi:MAG: hypothetical protein C0448_03585 [Sphingobacteriaceae bacterium]|nr:hypothetical protein [Sphingobacteriaceae bacterium]